MSSLRLAKEIFDLSIIESAMKDYKNLARIKIDQEEGYYVLNFEECKFSESQTKAEFENYVIDFLCARSRQ